MEKAKIVTALKDYNAQDVERFANYLLKIAADPKNSWMAKRKEEDLAELFKRVAKDGLVFDGVNITLQSTGVSYSYVAYKNKMLIAYPESTMDINLVYEKDVFNVAKESGSVVYSHTIVEPFNRKDSDIIGGYCVIKNKRGESITLLTKEELEKHRKVAKTDFIWKAWYVEMCLKTLIKKACKMYYSDIFESIDKEDNENYNLDNPLEIEIDLKGKIDECKNLAELTEIYNTYKNQAVDKAAFNSYIAIKKSELKL